jgi:hypothetical protein
MGFAQNPNYRPASRLNTIFDGTQIPKTKYNSRMSLECWYYLAGIFSFFVAVGGLIGLIIYAIDTRKMRVAAQEQIEATVTPCVLVFEDPDNQSVDAPLWFRNVGTGVALNIRWRFMGSTGKSLHEFPALASSYQRKATFLKQQVISYGAVECEFESLSGARTGRSV